MPDSENHSFKNRHYDDGPAYVTWSNEKEKALAYSNSDSLQEYSSFKRVVGYDQNFRNIDTNVSVRTGYTRKDYDYFRPKEAIPFKDKDIIKACMDAYEHNALIHNVIDLMGDFACQGIELIHPNPQIQKFYRQWFTKVNGKERSERFLNMLYRCANVIVKRSTAKLRSADIKRLRRAIASPDIEPEEPIKVGRNEVPYSYSFLNPLMLEIVGDELAPFVGKFYYALKIPPGLIRRILYAQSEVEKKMINSIPKDIREAIQSGQKELVLNPDKISAFYYKKDDWRKWALPMVAPLLDDLVLLDKNKLADLSALDGAISQVRLWTLGNLEHRILPKPSAIAKLSNMLMNNVGGGSVDIVWGPELTFKESASTVHQFLGSEKYKAVYEAIFQGLGIPPTLTGAATASGFTNNYISLKTLIERLNYGRDILISFWQQEISLVQQAMGFRIPAEIRFDRMTLSDESTEKALLIDLADRGLISVETVLDRFNENPTIEKVRIQREEKDRQANRMSERAGPYHRPQQMDDLRKIALQRGNVAPSEVGLELKPRKPGEKTPQEMMMRQRNQETKRKGVSGQGRPRNSKDSFKRKQKTVKPRTSAEFIKAMMWASQAQNDIAAVMNSQILVAMGKKNMRSLTNEQAEEAEMIKFSVLINMRPFIKVDNQSIAQIIKTHQFKLDPLAKTLLYEMIQQYIESNQVEPDTDMRRRMQASVYALITEESECQI